MEGEGRSGSPACAGFPLRSNFAPTNENERREKSARERNKEVQFLGHE